MIMSLQRSRDVKPENIPHNFTSVQQQIKKQVTAAKMQPDAHSSGGQSVC